MELQAAVVGGLIVILATVCGPSAATLNGQVLQGCTRGLPPACSVTCSVSSRLCKACCAALATFTQAPTYTNTSNNNNNNNTGDSSDISEQIDKSRDKVARCLASCVKYSVPELKRILDEWPSEDVAMLSAQLAKEVPAKKEDEWKIILNSRRIFSIQQLCDDGVVKC